ARRHPIATPFPYTTLFRSHHLVEAVAAACRKRGGDFAQGLAALDRAVLAVGRDRLRRWSRGGSWRRRRLWLWLRRRRRLRLAGGDRKSNTSELQSREKLVC